MADFNGGALAGTLTNANTIFDSLRNSNTFGITSPNKDGGISSLGGTGYQAYMVPGAMSPLKQTQAPAPITAAQGTKVKPKQSMWERMNASSKDQWQNFTGQGKYDASNPANQDTKGNFKAPANALSLQDKMVAGFGLASLVANAFDR